MAENDVTSRGNSQSSERAYRRDRYASEPHRALRLVSRLDVSAPRFPLTSGIRNRMGLQHEALRRLGILAARVQDADEMLTRVVRMREEDVQCRVVDVL